MEGVLEFVFFVGFLYWLFPSFFNEGVSRVNKMVDIATNRMFDAFSKLDPRDGHLNNDTLSTISNLKRFSADKKFKSALNREADNKIREAHLYDIKENAPQITLPKRRPLMGLSCYSCTPNSRQSLLRNTTGNLGLNNILEYTPAKSKYSLIQKTFNHLSQVYELKWFEYPQVAGTVEKDERLIQAIEKTALEQFADSDNNDEEYYMKLVKNNEKRAKKLLYDMRSTLSDFLLRFTSWVLYKLLPCFLTSVVVPNGQVDMLKQAGSSNLPLIFLPLHRSHLDYILISFILLNNNIRSPLVAAGDNLRIPFFGSLLRGLGAFFIKRRIDPVMGRKDLVYKAVLHTYMNECLRAGHNMEFFLEGGRTRTGKPCMPKYGILSVIIDSFMDGTIEDALLVPVSVNYEKLVDGNFVREQLGQPKEMETFGNAIRGIWHVLNSNYGMMRIDFNQPFSLRELVKTFNNCVKIQTKPSNKKLISNPSTTSLYGTDLVSDEQKNLVEAVSKHVLYDCTQSTAIMSTNALSFLLLNKFRDGANIEELILAVDELRNDLALVKKDLGFSGDSIDVILYAINLLGPALIKKERINNEEIIKPISMLPNVIELTYYSNTLVAHYAIDSLIATSLLSMNLRSRHFICEDDLLQKCQDLSSILQYEFLFCKPCQNFDSKITECLDYLIMKTQLFKISDVSEDTVKSRKIAAQFDANSSDEESRIFLKYEFNYKPELVEYLKFLKGLIIPILETYSIAAFCLDKLVGRSLLENELIKQIMDELKIGLKKKTLKYEECVSVDSIKNALKLFQKWEVLECHSEKKIRLYYLTENYDATESLRPIYDKINMFKNATYEQ